MQNGPIALSVRAYSQISPTMFMLPLLLPAAGALAAYAGSREALLAVYLLIGLTMFVAIQNRNSARRDLFFMVLIWSISLALILTSVLVSSNLQGQDIQDEYRISSEVVALQRWNIGESTLYNSVLSISIFVPVLSILSGLSTLTVDKLVLPLLYSIAPVILYKIYRTIISPRAAFFSTLIFVFYPSFYSELVALARQEVGEIILLGLLLVLLSSSGSKSARGIATILLTVGVVTAHYSLVFILLFLLVFSFVTPIIFPRKAVTLTNSRIALIVLVSTLGWYAFVASGTAISQLGQVFTRVTNGMLVDFFVPTTRPAVVLVGTGIAAGSVGLVHDLNRLAQYLVIGCFVLGFFAFARKSQESVPKGKMLPLFAATFVLLASAVILPYFAGAIEFTRIFHLALLLISPCFVFGINVFESVVGRMKSLVYATPRPRLHTRISVKYVVVAAILLSYFLFNSGWVWAVTLDRPTSLILDSQRMQKSEIPNVVAQYYNSFVFDPDVAAARWLRQYRVTNMSICSDETVRFGVLTSYGRFPRTGSGAITTLPGSCEFSQSYIYFSDYNNVRMFGYSEREGPGLTLFYLSTLWFKLGVKDRVYSSGAAIYA